MLEFINHTTIGQEKYCAFRVEKLVFVGLIREEQMMVVGGEKFHAHGMDFAGFQRIISIFRQ